MAGLVQAGSAESAVRRCEGKVERSENHGNGQVKKEGRGKQSKGEPLKMRVQADH